MTTDLFYTTADGYLVSEDGDYAIAVDGGSAVTSYNTNHFLNIGQNANYDCIEAFLEFNTASIPNDAVISQVTLSLHAYGDDSATPFTIECYQFDWGGGDVPVAAYRTDEHLSAMTLLGSYTIPGAHGWGFTDYHDLTSQPAFLNAINKSGPTRLVLASNRTRTAQVPGGLELVRCNSLDEGADAPLLTVTYTVPPPPVIPPVTAAATQHATVVYEFRFEQRTVDNELVEDISRAVVKGSASIDLDNDRPVIRTMSCQLDPARLPASFTAPGSYVAPWMDVRSPSGTWTAYQLGLYRANRPRKTYTPGAELWEVNFNDLTIEMLRRRTTQPFTIAAGNDYLGAVRSLVEACGLRHSFLLAGEVTPIDFTWPPRTSYHQMAADLLGGLNYYPPWPNATGVFNSRLRDDPNGRTPDVTYYTEQSPRLIISPYSIVEDDSVGPNRVVAVTKDPTRTALSVIRQNADPDCIVSIPSVGQEVPADLTNDHVIDLTRLRDHADYLLYEAEAYATKASLLTAIDPARSPHEVYQLYIAGIEFGSKWLVDSWQMPLSTGAQMSTEMGRIHKMVLEDGV